MPEFRGVVNIKDNGDIICFCSHEEMLRGDCSCRLKYDCPEAIISIEALPGTKPSELGIKNVKKVSKSLNKEVTKIKEGLSHLEKAVKDLKFRI